ncbi:MAG: ABC transporter ATP-binding protein [Acidimicrobiales bacterium]
MKRTGAASRRVRSLWRMRAFVRPYRWQLVAMAVSAALGIGAGIAVPLVTEGVVNGPIAHHHAGSLVPLGLLALGLGLAEALGNFGRRWIQSHGVLAAETDLRNHFYAHLQSLDVSFHDRWQSGQLLSRAMADVSTLRRFLGFGLIFLVVNAATFAVVVALLVRLDTLLGAVVAAGAVPVIVVAARFEHRYNVVSRRLQDQQGDITTTVEEAAVGIRVIKSLGRRRHVGAGFGRQVDALYSSSLEKVRLQATYWSLLQVVPNLTLAAVLVLGGLAVADGRMSLGALVAFVSLMLLLVWPVESLGFILAAGQEAATAADRLWEVLDVAPAIADPPDVGAGHGRAGGAGHGRIETGSGPRAGAAHISRPRAPAAARPGRLRFEGVGFSYPGGGPPVLRGVDLEVAPGETLALVGATGSGKTSLVALVPRLYDVSSGRILLDGTDIRDLPLAHLRRLVGVAFEEPILFSVSVAENVRLGSPFASDAEVEEALEVARAGFVAELPWGIDTRVGEQGLTLSGGQRQRIALARAIVGRPRVLVLDDPLSALDVHTEALVEEALRRLLSGTTAIVVAHRPSTVALADRVALLDGGSVAAVGTHAELMERAPSYRAVLSQRSEAATR